ncbi:hypothetical protein Q0812_10570 [Brevundimonas sp. 2R-24]|uniref:Uncharacterized protein n=1 Tax=Peiella sedimenti TaxID=3061083 RepID=A0ABT8SQ94_9CAUL|nr:hypothetical protein [Caulobacteraceae bacterium XZ-24]
MTRCLSVFAILAALAPAGGVAAQQLPTYDQVGLQWQRMPSLRHMQRLYGRNVAGRVAASASLNRYSVELACTPDARGELDCTVLNAAELEPRWVSAGEQLMERASVRAVDGGSPAGRTFGYTVRFGNWTSRALPDRFHPVEAGLRWTRRPEMSERWGMLGQPAGATYAANFTCATNADGGLQCQLRGLEGGATAEFGEAAAEAMAEARVTSADRRPVEGRQFDWTVAIMRQGNCGAGAASGYGRFVSGDDQNRGNVFTDGGAGPVQAVGASGSLPDYRVGGDPRCQPVMLTVNQPAAGPRSDD